MDEEKLQQVNAEIEKELLEYLEKREKNEIEETTQGRSFFSLSIIIVVLILIVLKLGPVIIESLFKTQ